MLTRTREMKGELDIPELRFHLILFRIVEFASKRDMERAMDKFDDYELNGRRIKVCVSIMIITSH